MRIVGSFVVVKSFPGGEHPNEEASQFPMIGKFPVRRYLLSGMEVSNEKDASQQEGSFPVTKKLSSENKAIQ